MHAVFADTTTIQNKLFSELSRMFGSEVPLYDKSLLVNRVCNEAVCGLLSRIHPGFSITAEQIERTSSERHGAIRIGREDEYRWVARYFAVFGMQPHNFYDMTSVGNKSQPIIATAFRSVVNPEHRVFTSLLRLSYFDDATAARIGALLEAREVFSPTARGLIERAERHGGLTPPEADELIREGTDRIFKWTGAARDHTLYKELCVAGFKIAADIACFSSHHLNHLTPNTFCMDLYTATMKRCMGEIDHASWRDRTARALGHLAATADRHFMRLHFRHLSWDEIERFGSGSVTHRDITDLIDSLATRISETDLRLDSLPHAGFKDFTEGPSADTPVLLRQDAYKALTEPVVFTNPDGTRTDTVHTARFGEIEERFYATTPAGRKLYDECLAAADALREGEPKLAANNPALYERRCAEAFAPFPKTLPELLDAGLVYGRYEPSPSGIMRAGTIRTADIGELVALGHVRAEGLRYEDFLPVSAAGIFASNLNQYGTASTAAERPIYTKAMLEAVLGKPIVDADLVCRAIRARSLLLTFAALRVTELLDPSEQALLEQEAGYLDAFSPSRPRDAAIV